LANSLVSFGGEGLSPPRDTPENRWLNSASPGNGRAYLVT
jgi:hypothetical protein